MLSHVDNEVYIFSSGESEARSELRQVPITLNQYVDVLTLMVEDRPRCWHIIMQLFSVPTRELRLDVLARYLELPEQEVLDSINGMGYFVRDMFETFEIECYCGEHCPGGWCVFFDRHDCGERPPIFALREIVAEALTAVLPTLPRPPF